MWTVWALSLHLESRKSLKYLPTVFLLLSTTGCLHSTSWLNIFLKLSFRCVCLEKCGQSKIGLEWTRFRTAVLAVVDTAAFEWFILVLIFASSVTLCFEDIHLDENPRLKKLLYWTNLAFSVIFIIEMFFKWVALGFNKYFSSFWTLLDFLIVFVRIYCNFQTFLLKMIFV